MIFLSLFLSYSLSLSRARTCTRVQSLSTEEIEPWPYTVVGVQPRTRYDVTSRSLACQSVTTSFSPPCAQDAPRDILRSATAKTLTRFTITLYVVVTFSRCMHPRTSVGYPLKIKRFLYRFVYRFFPGRCGQRSVRRKTVSDVPRQLRGIRAAPLEVRKTAENITFLRLKRVV